MTTLRINEQAASVQQINNMIHRRTLGVLLFWGEYETHTRRIKNDAIITARNKRAVIDRLSSLVGECLRRKQMLRIV